MTETRAAARGLLMTALAPVVPQLLGSVFNIWYNGTVIGPILTRLGLEERFVQTVIAYNLSVYPVAIALWVWVIASLRAPFRSLAGPGSTVDPRVLSSRRRIINLPWLAAGISAVGWLIGIPILLLSLASAGNGFDPQLSWHLPISFLISAFIAVTQTFFLTEISSHRYLFPLFFRNVRPDRLDGIHPLSVRGRGWLWAISAGVCPICALLLLIFAPGTPGSDSRWFALFVGVVGILFGLASAALLSRLVAEPIERLRAATRAVAEGNYDLELPVTRADEFGSLTGEFNHMVSELREKERVRMIFGAHVGRTAAEQILASGPGVGGVERVVTIMFVDIRSFTARSARCEPQQVVRLLNDFLGAMVGVVEDHGGLVNKFLGDGFMAIFGLGQNGIRHADAALRTGRAMIARMRSLNATLAQRDEAPLEIGIGIHTGRAIVGSIGSPERMEFTAIGSTVNLASRIEGLTKEAGVPLLLTGDTRSALSASDGLRELAPRRVRGVEEPVALFSI